MGVQYWDGGDGDGGEGDAYRYGGTRLLDKLEIQVVLLVVYIATKRTKTGAKKKKFRLCQLSSFF